ncbi:hypothetical protein PHYPSEUDO_007798 [Phytophthora pseudosyringae]|uniref:Uncharacterized protein n=1 Tax=Phytophthora pseudosyringae TaxID=221518 RepID=A0A8T1VFS3_9STRA|nr:hypothetical protein PHYPSEUDO_007798 [Phytophthora pseudosyringae]
MGSFMPPTSAFEGHVLLTKAERRTPGHVPHADADRRATGGGLHAVPDGSSQRVCQHGRYAAGCAGRRRVSGAERQSGTLRLHVENVSRCINRARCCPNRRRPDVAGAGRRGRRRHVAAGKLTEESRAALDALRNTVPATRDAAKQVQSVMDDPIHVLQRHYRVYEYFSAEDAQYVVVMGKATAALKQVAA